MSEAPGFARNTASVLLARLLSSALDFAGGILVARFLLAQGKGELAAIMLVCMAAFRILNLGFGQAIVRLLGAQPEEREAYVGSVGVLWLGWIGAYCLLMAGATWLLRGDYLLDLDMGAYWIAALAPPLMLLEDVGKGCLRGLMRIATAASVAVISSATRLVALVLLLGIADLGLRGAAAASVVGPLVGAAFAIAALRFSCGIVPRANLGRLRPLFQLSGSVYLYNMLLFFNFRFDTYLIKIFNGVRELGLYSASVAVVEALWILPTSASAVLYATLAQVDAEPGPANTARISRIASLVVALAGLALVILAGPIFALFGREFSGSIPSFLALLGGVWAMGVASVIAADYLARGDVLRLVASAGVALAVNAVSMVVLIPSLGGVGAGLASTFAYATFLIVVATWYCREHDLRPRDLLVPSRADLAFVAERVRSLLGMRRGD